MNDVDDRLIMFTGRRLANSHLPKLSFLFTVFGLQTEISHACGKSLQYVSSFKYLGRIITDCVRDDADIQRKIKNMSVRSNILKLKFAKCSQDVKVVLLKAHSVCLYDASLWKCFNSGSVNKLYVQAIIDV